MITKDYAVGEIITKEGDFSDYAYYLKSGTVEVLVNTPDGEKIVAEQFEGDFFGEMGVILEEPRMATIRAKTHVEVLAYDIKSFEENVINNDELRAAYMPNLFERIRVISSMLRKAIVPEGATDDYTPTHSYDVHGLVDAREIHELDGTPEADKALALHLKSVEPLPGAAQCVDVDVKRFPFNIGRHSESKILVENDFYVEDQRPHQVSRGHCSIEQRGGQFIVRDRFSSTGTVVNGVPLGKASRSFVATLKLGENELILGDEKSRFKFVLTVQ
ncbi:MAG: cyclic nucleotide-binding domain-containing protein [Coraliomargarita sp.]